MKTPLVLAIAAIAATTFAAGPKENGKKPPFGGMPGLSDPIVQFVSNPKFAEKIGLSEEQKEKIKEIDKANKNTDLRKQLKESMEKQTELLKAEKVDEAAVMAEIDKAFDLRKEMAKRQTKRIIAIKAVLTPEQVEKALAEIKNRKAAQKQKAEKKAKEKND